MGEIVRLQKYIAMSGVASRRAAETMIQEGRVKVNGKKITEQGVKIEIGADNVSVDDKPIKLKNKKYYIMLSDMFQPQKTNLTDRLLLTL